LESLLAADISPCKSEAARIFNFLFMRNATHNFLNNLSFVFLMEDAVKPKKKGYDFSEVEPRIKKFWEDEKIYKYDPSKENVYSIDTPPPTVSGAMHIGHAFSYAQQDFVARYRRMKQGIFYPFGTDDNGIPTGRLVEKLKGVKSHEMTRTDFIKLCLQTLKEITPDFVEDWKRIGVSADYDIYYSTIDDNSRKISQKSFLDLYKAGLVYMSNFPTLWCPECQTSIAQAELEDKEKDTDLVYIKGELDDGSYIIYATTRPELHPGCIGISLKEDGIYVKAKKNSETWVISKDAFEEMKEKFDLELIEEFEGKKLIGKPVKIAFAKGPVKVSHDISAKTEYGTGVVYYCSYGGLDCVQWLTRHPEIKPIHIMEEDGTYNSEPIKSLNSEEARKKIIQLLDKEGLLVEKERLHHAVNTHDKCGTDIEYIAVPQWFIKIMDKKDYLIEKGRSIDWRPKHMLKRYENWVNGLEWDWNISRSRHFGVPIPVWKCGECRETILAEEDELPVDPTEVEKKCPKCGTIAVGEKMVLDTWATSSMSPVITSNLIDDRIVMPYSLRPQAHDIIRTWAFYTIVKSLYHENTMPWENIMISGMVTRKGEKMSKSKGNGIEPGEVIEKYGADALRFWASGSRLGGDLDYQEQDLVAGKKIVTKLWNASKFVFMNLEDYDGENPQKLEKVDEEFLRHLDNLISVATKHFENYNYSFARGVVDRFFWSDFCDNYLEIIKKRVYNEAGDKKVSAQYTLYKSLLAILKLFAPIIPFITEEVYQTYFRKNEKNKSIHLCDWPSVSGGIGSSEDFEKFKEILSKVRQEKTNNKKSMNSEITLTLPKEDINSIGEMIEDFKAVANASSVGVGEFKVEFL
jgi:valyl-tRNA synthetase